MWPPIQPLPPPEYAFGFLRVVLAREKVLFASHKEGMTAAVATAFGSRLVLLFALSDATPVQPQCEYEIFARDGVLRSIPYLHGEVGDFWRHRNE